MSSVIAAAGLWVFAVGFVTAQPWIVIFALLATAFAIYLFRDRGAGAIALLFSSFGIMSLTTFHFPLRLQNIPDVFFGLRSKVSEQIVGISDDAAALVLGLSIGDDSLVSANLAESMRITSLTHLMAVSGANCAIVVGTAYLLMAKFSIRFRVTFSLLILGAYVGLVGFQPSVLRASVMAAAVMFSLSSGRRVNPLAALALSVLILLAISPTLSVNYGFVLSVLATAGILILTPKTYLLLNRRLPRWIAMAVAISFSAQLFCLPVLLGLQGGVPTYAIVANLICEPLVAPVTVLGLLGVIFCWCPPLSSATFWLASLVAWPITQVANILSGLPFATSPWMAGSLGVLAASLLAFGVVTYLFAKRAITKTLSLLVVVGLAATSFGVILNQAVRHSLWPMPDWQVASCDVGQGDATVIRDGQSVAVIDVGRDEKLIDSCLSKLGVAHIDLLVLTHFDADHVNGLSGALRGRTVSLAMLTGFVDDRPGANNSKLRLEQKGVAVVTAEVGLQGHISKVSWKVLSPTRTAVEAEDSNDASIAMLWHFSNFQLLTLADTGERAQQRLAASLATWWTEPNIPLVLKVSHHGSADQYPELHEWLKPQVALISVGKNNGYGHPTRRTIGTLERVGASILRTDLLGSVAIKNHAGKFEVAFSGSS